MLVVDATQGVEAQTLANAYLAIHNNLTIVPCINKVDLPSAVPEMAREQIEEIIGIPARHAVLTSGKVGTGVRDLLEQIVHDVPAPTGDPTLRSRRCSSTRGSTSTAASRASCAS